MSGAARLTDARTAFASQTAAVFRPHRENIRLDQYCQPGAESSDVPVQLAAQGPLAWTCGQATIAVQVSETRTSGLQSLDRAVSCVHCRAVDFADRVIHLTSAVPHEFEMVAIHNLPGRSIVLVAKLVLWDRDDDD